MYACERKNIKFQFFYKINQKTLKLFEIFLEKNETIINY
jgi:hypothetical protein